MGKVDGAAAMRKLSAHERQALLERVAELAAAATGELAQTISAEVGKPIAEARGEAARIPDLIRLSAAEGARMHGETVPVDAAPNAADKLGFTLRQPCGVVVAVTPFNYPALLVGHKLYPALAAGNAVILKPASSTPLTALVLTRLLLEAGLPANAIQCLTGSGAEVGTALCADECVRKISFTGSTAVGRRIASVAGVKNGAPPSSGYGGSLEISQVFWKDLIDAPQAVSLSLDAKNLQLLKLTETLGWYRFGGTLSGSIPKIEWSGESLRSQGQIQVDVFGGRMQIGQLEIENPFSSVPAIKLDARFQDIQLEQASETFAFGRISGILEGTVSDLILANKQPSQFRADLHSVEKRGFSQHISVESLNKITVLSSGNDAGALYGGIASFFDNFRYSKLGFRATLKNDKLTLRGVESRDGQEYLVVGSLIPPAVNVISHTQEIAFSELLSRLERIQKSENAQKAVQ